MVSGNREMVESSQEEMALLDGPGNCQALEFHDGIPAFCISEKS